MSSRPSLPEHPELAEVADSREEIGWAAEIYDAAWRLVWVSGEILEHLEDSDAEALGIDPDAVVYRTIEQLPEESDKAKRDAGSVPRHRVVTQGD